MTGLTLQLYAQCREVLLKCSEFDDQRALRSIFVVSELEPFRDSLPEATNKNDRVNMTLDFLSTRFLDDGTATLPLLLVALRDRKSREDQLYVELEVLCNETERELGSTRLVEIPFVIAAMTRGEAQSLAEGTAFASTAVPPLAQSRFKVLQSTLESYGLVDLPSWYDSKRDQWRLQKQNDANITIEAVVRDTVAHVNDSHRRPRGLSLVYPSFQSEAFFDPSRRARLWTRFGQSGCVMIIDAVSLFHPELSNTLLQSGLASNDHVALFVLSPVSSNIIDVNRLIEEEISAHHQWTFTRLYEHLDKLCEFGVGGMRTLQRWLNTIMPDLEDIASRDRAYQSNLQLMRQQYGTPRGYEQVIFGRRG